MQEYLDAQSSSILDIALENWNPQEYHEESLHNSPPVQVPNPADRGTSMNTIIENMCKEQWTNIELYLPETELLYKDQQAQFYNCIDELHVEEN